MVRAFVIRGFGQHEGVDFELIHQKLIGPALTEAGVEDGGSGEIFEAGNVREDMLRELYLADIVVADVSVDNASVFYELGIRHALRPRSTVLISARTGKIPVDLGTDRYLRYDPDSPRASLPQLAQVLREALTVERDDSPVHGLLAGIALGPHTSSPDRGHDPQAAAAGDKGQAGIEDQMLNAVWRGHRQWSKAAATAQTSLSRWRLSNLTLLVAGAVVAAFAAQTWIVSTAAATLAAVSAALLAAAGFVQGSMLTSENTSRWTGARAASEALKAETYRYLAGVKPYAGADRAERLKEQLATVQTRSSDLLVGQQLAAADDRALPDVRTFESYRQERAQGQAQWHRDRIAEHMSTARTLRFCQLGFTAAGAVLAAVAAALPGAHLAAWIAAATTIAAAFATHIAAIQHQRIAASYATTADQLQRLVDGVDPKTASADQQAQFVADVERVLAVQNDGWVDLLGTTAKTS
jgi:conflict system pore-forming effector with SLATT domain/uncharacterized protein DUF4231